MFPKQNRLTQKRDIDRAFKRGNRSAAGFLFCSSLRNNLGYNRYTVIIGTKSGLKAAGRNLFKRRTRSVLQDMQDKLPSSVDMVLGVKGQFNKVPKYSEIEENVSKCLSRLHSGASNHTRRPSR